jgi:hypothetical protein
MSHHAIQVTLSVYIAISCLLYIACIGRPQKPAAPPDAIARVVICALMLWAIWSL